MLSLVPCFSVSRSSSSYLSFFLRRPSSAASYWPRIYPSIGTPIPVPLLYPFCGQVSLFVSFNFPSEVLTFVASSLVYAVVASAHLHSTYPALALLPALCLRARWCLLRTQISPCEVWICHLCCRLAHQPQLNISTVFIDAQKKAFSVWDLGAIKLFSDQQGKGFFDDYRVVFKYVYQVCISGFPAFQACMTTLLIKYLSVSYDWPSEPVKMPLEYNCDG